MVPFSKHFPSAIKEWDNSVYAYNLKETVLLPAIDKIVIRLVKSYFNAYFLLNGAKDSTPTQSVQSAVGGPADCPQLSVLNKTYVSKPEIKHTNSKVIITIYKYSSSLKNKAAQTHGALASPSASPGGRDTQDIIAMSN